MSSLHRKAFAPAQNPYRVELLFTHMNGDFGAISVTERSSAMPISKWKGTYEISVHTIPELLFVKGGGYSIYPWVGRCGAVPHTLTLFKTNIADFPTLFKTEFRFLIPCLRHLSCLRQKLINRYPD